MKKILIVTETFYPYSSASANCIMSILKKMPDNFYEVHILTVKNDRNLKNEDKYNNFIIHRFGNTGGLIYRVLRKIERYFNKNSILLINYLSYFTKLYKLQKKIKFDKIISVSSLMHTSYATLKVKSKLNNFKFILYQMDPFCDNYNLNSKYYKQRNDIEKEIYIKADKIITTDIIKENLLKNGLYEYKDKVFALEFPNLKELKIKKTEGNIDFDNRYINFTFSGLMYPKIRNPYYMLDLFSKLCRDDIRLYLIGSGTNKIIDRYKDILKDKLILVKRVPQVVSDNAMLSSDILINVGNSAVNQVPSKIFDYFGAGKPIINFVKFENCPSLKYTKKYPLCLNIVEKEVVAEEDLEKVNSFIDKYRKERIDYKSVSEIFYNCTDEYVSSEFFKIID